MFNNELFQNMNMESNINGDNNYINNDMNVDVNMMNMNNMKPGENMQHGPAMNEGVQEKCIHRTFIHEVPHVCPIHTRIINHHVYKHTYRPRYTCSEENTVSNIQCGSCCQFR